ncbi:DUF2927 domain-containing protein [Ruixingdingia sedimenti]|uniref:DUF2927 domain-containing protein n=1 Tax=Ruixingdingia sedimenti TaxID=3073604 RepID=A0ABU1F5B4_9RHOB|nr:DUF2927 domain-containing protein [Xinfangfangia sp. LG-4]MDR5652062.1 DUF2927 domain-containing protein [Xinfangfangia sp. LG-4]
MPKTPALRLVPLAAALAMMGLLQGCDLAPPKAPPPVRPAPRVEPKPAPAPDPASLAAQAHFARVQSSLIARGLLRTDGGGTDTPFGTRQLVDNFVRIALYDEYVGRGGTLTARQQPAALRRWERPVRIGVRFGASVPAEDRARDRAQVAAYAARLARASGHPVSFVDQGANYWLYIVGETERKGYGPEWAALFPGLTPDDLLPVTQMPMSTFCMVLAISDGESPVYTGGLAVIRAELPDLLRLSCIHEELAQGLGLANDSPVARPTIFNDDEEFALLTRHDELLLKMLYDPRLRPGMREAEARPVLERIAPGLVGGGS